MGIEEVVLPESPHALSEEEVLAALRADRRGLTRAEALARLRQFGRNALPRAAPPGVLAVFGRQFANPLIYILLLASAFSLSWETWPTRGSSPRFS
jgi:magnesium-transporting ATPase (P-type)